MWYYTFYAGLIAVAGSALFQALRLFGVALSRRAVVATSARSMTVSTPIEAPAWAGRMATLLARMGAAILVLGLVLRTAATGHPPYSNMWEYLVAFGTATLVFYVAVERRYRHPAIGAAVLAVALTLLVLPELLFTSEITSLVPALQNNRLLAVHVALMLLSYSVLAVGFGAAVLYLVQASRLRRAALPSLEVLDDLAFRAVMVGFPLLAAGIALGAYWGNIAWGRYWGWDPKETTALITWLVFAAYMHTRGLARWRGARSAWLIVVGFSVIVFNIFAVNFWIAGLHSYAGS